MSGFYTSVSVSLHVDSIRKHFWACLYETAKESRLSTKVLAIKQPGNFYLRDRNIPPHTKPAKNYYKNSIIANICKSLICMYLPRFFIHGSKAGIIIAHNLDGSKGMAI
jgi:hypothetical protein